jgi:4-hydroxy-4-methyl-2-oxoglutarate aldolase
VATPAELAKVRDRLFGLIDVERIVRVDIDHPDPEVSKRFLALIDLCSTVADALDEVGVGGVVATSSLAPRSGHRRIAGPAITIRYSQEGGNVGALRATGEAARLADRDLYAVGRGGDVAVFACSGGTDSSVMGGLSARWAKALGIAGCVVDGAVRDVETIARLELPVWSREVTPQTGKHRMQAIEINGTVSIAGVTVEPGDFVVGDSTGLCVIPQTHITAVLSICEEADATEMQVVQGMADGLSVSDLQDIYPASRW